MATHAYRSIIPTSSGSTEQSCIAEGPQVTGTPCSTQWRAGQHW